MENLHSTNSPENIVGLLDSEFAQPVNAGHMMYDKQLVTDQDKTYFVKTSDDTLLTDPYQARRMWEYLIKEQFAYEIVARNGFESVPQTTLTNHSLIMDAYTDGQGWHWEAPRNKHQQESYVADVIKALENLQCIDGVNEILEVDPVRSIDRLFNEGWQTMTPDRLIVVQNKLMI